MLFEISIKFHFFYYVVDNTYFFLNVLTVVSFLKYFKEFLIQGLPPGESTRDIVTTS